MSAEGGVVHREVLELEATPALVLEFVVTPERLCDYFSPPPISAGVFEAGRSLWIHSSTGMCLLERVEEQCAADRTVLFVTIASGLEPPSSPQEIKAAATITLWEDWVVAPSGAGTTLTKTWRDVHTTFDLGFPIENAMRETAASESADLVERWNEAARA